MAAFNFGELFKLLPYLGAGAGGYIEGDQLRQQREQAAARQRLAEGEAARAAAQEERAAGLYPLQRRSLEQGLETGAAKERREQADFDRMLAAAPPWMRSAFEKARQETVGTGGVDPNATIEQLAKAAGFTPADPQFWRAEAAGKAAEGAEADRRAQRLIRYREMEKDALKALAPGGDRPAIAALIEGKLRQTPEDAAMLDKFMGKKDLEAFLAEIRAEIQKLSGAAPAVPAAGALAPVAPGAPSDRVKKWQQSL